MPVRWRKRKERVMRLNKLWYPLALLAVVALSALPLTATAAPAAAPPAQADLVGNAGLESYHGNGTASNWEAWLEATANPGNGSLNYAYKHDLSPEHDPNVVSSG